MFYLARRYRVAWLNAMLCGIPLFGALLCGQSDDPGSERPKVTAVRFWSLGDTTRVAIEATGEFQFRSDRLQNPERLFFDLIGAKPQINPKGVSVIPVGDRFIRQIRVAETQRGVTRVVLDLNAEVKFSTSQLANPDRLIIELHALDLMAHFEPPPTGPVNNNAAGQRTQVPPQIVEPPDSSVVYKRDRSKQVRPDPLASVPVSSPLPLPQPPPPTTTIAKTSPFPARVETVDPEPSVTPPSMAVGPLAKRATKADTMIRVLGLKLRRVVLDPGHGGSDSGTSGPDGLREKDVALDVAKRLGALIQERLGSEVVYTRTDDNFVPLARRTAIANEANADLFLSIHVNSSPIRSAAGVETYYLNFTTSRNALETAARENAGAEQNIHELQDLLRKIALKDKVDESREFASRIQTSLGSVSSRMNHNAKDRGIKKAPFVVLIGASMPAVLVEIGFITNSQDEILMRRGDHRQRIADALYRGFSSYANTLSHFQVAQQSGRISGQP
jgi:N-acetylmuramoyl-L-alanine amidase